MDIIREVDGGLNSHKKKFTNVMNELNTQVIEEMGHLNVWLFNEEFDEEYMLIKYPHLVDMDYSQEWIDYDPESYS